MKKLLNRMIKHNSKKSYKTLQDNDLFNLNIDLLQEANMINKLFNRNKKKQTTKKYKTVQDNDFIKFNLDLLQEVMMNKLKRRNKVKMSPKRSAEKAAFEMNIQKYLMHTL